MHRSDATRADIPRTLRGLYPRARTRRRLHVVAPRRGWRHRAGAAGFGTQFIAAVVLVASALAAIAVSAAIADLFEGHVSTATTDAIGAVGLVAGAIAALVVWVIGRDSRPEGAGWALHRHLVRADPAVLDDLPDPTADWVPAGATREVWHGVVGRRRVGMHLARLWWKDDEDDMCSCYVGRIRLPAATAERFPASRYQRAERVTLFGGGLSGGTLLELESHRLAMEGRLHVRGGDPLDWRQLFDPALVDLLADGIDVEWFQVDDQLVLRLPGRGDHLDPVRIDTIAVAAAAIERRIARIVGHGHDVPSTNVEAPAALGRRATVGRQLRRQRAHDLDLDPEQLFLELARYTTDAEVASVRAKVDAGTFPLHMLDDLVHHRRAAFWGAARESA